VFFFEKKNQKTFGLGFARCCGRVPAHEAAQRE
jgi:hypothetical protein